jgi:hypothetical protein
VGSMAFGQPHSTCHQKRNEEESRLTWDSTHGEGKLRHLFPLPRLIVEVPLDVPHRTQRYQPQTLPHQPLAREPPHNLGRLARIAVDEKDRPNAQRPQGQHGGASRRAPAHHYARVDAPGKWCGATGTGARFLMLSLRLEKE